MSGESLGKRIWREITMLKLLNTNPNPKFILEKTPFDDLDDDEAMQVASDSGREHVIIGRIFPNSEIYNKGAYKIEMKLTSTFPMDAPEVRFLTKIYHPNVSNDGKICNELLNKVADWTPTTSLVDVVQVVTKHVDEPDVTHPSGFDLAKEYSENRPEFNRKAAEHVKDFALPRS